MLRVRRRSGEEAANNYSHLKRGVHQLEGLLDFWILLGVASFRRRILHENVILEDDMRVTLIAVLQLVVHPFRHTSEMGGKGCLMSVSRNFGILVLYMSHGSEPRRGLVAASPTASKTSHCCWSLTFLASLAWARPQLSWAVWWVDATPYAVS